MTRFPSFQRWVRSLAFLAALVAPIADSPAMVLRVYDETSHKRFIPFPVNAQINTGSIFSDTDLTGIGFRSSTYPTVQCALVSRQHVVFANHFSNRLVGATLTFINADNEVFQRSCGAQVIIEEDGTPSDLILVELSAPIDADSGIAPLPYYDVTPYLNVALGVLGRDNTNSSVQSDRFPVVGRASVDFVAAPLLLTDTDIETMAYRFDYLDSPIPPLADDDDCYLESGDSGSPSFVKVGGTAALIGIHSGIGVFTGGRAQFDTYIPHYISQLDSVLNPLGYRMRPLNAPPTSLSGTGGASQATPRKAMALDYLYTLENTGSETAGNVEVELQFASGQGPDSVSVQAGWVSYGSGDRWTLRRSTLAPAADGTLTVSWSAAPSVDTLSFTLIHRSDASTESSTAVDLPLADSYADWASGLVAPGIGEDADLDGLLNLLEYALGGDPQHGGLLFEDNGPLQPVLEQGTDSWTLSHPERTDKTERGLSYGLVFSSDLVNWDAPDPPGLGSITVPYSPAVDGFVQRRWTWDAGGIRRFVQLQVSLSE